LASIAAGLLVSTLPTYPPAAPADALPPIPPPEQPAVNLPDLAARCRLEALAVGLMRECAAIAAGNDPLVNLERKAYLAAVRGAVSGLESARVVPAKARQRIEGAGRRSRG
jgi:hypothetical protein